MQTIRTSRQENVGELSATSALPEDFIKFGMIPEFMGRVPVICISGSAEQR